MSRHFSCFTLFLRRGYSTPYCIRTIIYNDTAGVCVMIFFQAILNISHHSPVPNAGSVPMSAVLVSGSVVFVTLVPVTCHGLSNQNTCFLIKYAWRITNEYFAVWKCGTSIELTDQARIWLRLMDCQHLTLGITLTYRSWINTYRNTCNFIWVFQPLHSSDFIAVHTHVKIFALLGVFFYGI